jgi:hypothetical protein
MAGSGCYLRVLRLSLEQAWAGGLKLHRSRLAATSAVPPKRQSKSFATNTADTWLGLWVRRGRTTIKQPKRETQNQMQRLHLFLANRDPCCTRTRVLKQHLHTISLLVIFTLFPPIPPTHQRENWGTRTNLNLTLLTVCRGLPKPFMEVVLIMNTCTWLCRSPMLASRQHRWPRLRSGGGVRNCLRMFQPVQVVVQVC